jgi:ribosomal protein S1
MYVTFQTLTEGMLVVGCIADIRQYDMWLSLPGRIVGRVPITSISTQYTNALQSLAEGGDQVIFAIKQTRELYENLKRERERCPARSSNISITVLAN